jgi:hypothetical protein
MSDVDTDTNMLMEYIKLREDIENYTAVQAENETTEDNKHLILIGKLDNIATEMLMRLTMYKLENEIMKTKLEEIK